MVTTGAMPVSFPVVRLAAGRRRVSVAPGARTTPPRDAIPRTDEVRSARGAGVGYQAASGRANLPLRQMPDEGMHSSDRP